MHQFFERYKNVFERLFLAHPHSIGETYMEHMGKAIGIAAYLLVFCVVPVLIHAIFTGWFQTTASRYIFGMNEFLQKRQNVMNE